MNVLAIAEQIGAGIALVFLGLIAGYLPKQIRSLRVYTALTPSPGASYPHVNREWQLIPLIAVVIVAASSDARGALSTKSVQYSGDVIYTDGNRLHYERVVQHNGEPVMADRQHRSLAGRLSILYKGTERAITPVDVSSITVVSITNVSRAGGAGFLKGATLKIRFRNGKEIIAELADDIGTGFYVEHIDELTGGPTIVRIKIYTHESGKLRPLVRSIHFGENLGTMRLNPKTNQFYPPLFLFDPYTGDKLIWRTP